MVGVVESAAYDHKKDFNLKIEDEDE